MTDLRFDWETPSTKSKISVSILNKCHDPLSCQLSKLTWHKVTDSPSNVVTVQKCTLLGSRYSLAIECFSNMSKNLSSIPNTNIHTQTKVSSIESSRTWAAVIVLPKTSPYKTSNSFLLQSLYKHNFYSR